MEKREDEPASRSKNAPGRGGSVGKMGDIHEREIAHHSIERGVGKTVQMLRIVLEIGDT